MNDFKKPIEECQNDMRTSTYPDRIYMNDGDMPGTEMRAKFRATKPYELDQILEQCRVSDYKANFQWKPGVPNKITIPKLGTKVDFIKDFEDRRLRFLSRPMRPACSVMHNDYIWATQPEFERPTPIRLPTPVAASYVVVNRAESSYTKLLDPAATTSRLDYVHYTPSELLNSVARHDNITFWNWHEKSTTTPKRILFGRDDVICNAAAAREYPKRCNELPSQVKHVPNSGMTTEVRANYVLPLTRSIDFNTADIKHPVVCEEVTPASKATESKLYGSGERTVQYV